MGFATSGDFIGSQWLFALLKYVIRQIVRPQLCRLDTISPCFLLSLLHFLLKQAGEK